MDCIIPDRRAFHILRLGRWVPGSLCAVPRNAAFPLVHLGLTFRTGYRTDYDSNDAGQLGAVYASISRRFL